MIIASDPSSNSEFMLRRELRACSNLHNRSFDFKQKSKEVVNRMFQVSWELTGASYEWEREICPEEKDDYNFSVAVPSWCI